MAIERQRQTTNPKSIMSAPIIPQSTTGFAAFPREIRDMIFLNIAAAAEVEVDLFDNYHLRFPTPNTYTDCILMLHEWAPESHIAKAACEMLWSYGTFSHGHFDSDVIIDPRKTLYLGSPLEDRKAVGTPIDLRECVRDLQLYTRPNPPSNDKSQEYLTQTPLKLKQELSELHQFPHLRRVYIQIYIRQNCDAYFAPMAIVESISGACKELIARIGKGLRVSLSRDSGYHISNFKYITDPDITWMWKAPSREERDYVEQGVATVDQRIRVLIADGVGSKAKRTLLEELRDACKALPQEKDEIKAMESWEPCMGVSEDEFEHIKKYWTEYKGQNRDRWSGMFAYDSIGTLNEEKIRSRY